MAAAHTYESHNEIKTKYLTESAARFMKQGSQCMLQGPEPLKGGQRADIRARVRVVDSDKSICVDLMRAKQRMLYRGTLGARG